MYSSNNVMLDVVAGMAPLATSRAAKAEPPSLVLFASGLIGVLARRLKKRQPCLSVVTWIAEEIYVLNCETP